MINLPFHSSYIQNSIYEIMEPYETKGLDLYPVELEAKIVEILEAANVEYYEDVHLWPDCDGGSNFFAWVEEGRLHTVSYDFKY